jgi:uracil-DNA glycosylase
VIDPALTDRNAALASFLGFWAEAGVDVCLDETPVDRLALGRARLNTPPKAAAVVEVESAPRVGLSALPSHALESARVAAASATNLAELEAAIAAYDGCPLKAQGARQAVFARGRADAPVMIIGEGPGAEEDLQGAPFVGRAGKLLDRMLRAAGLSEEVFITNTVFWRPPGNRTPTLEEQATCLPFVERAIALVKPKALLLVGGASAKAMLRRSEGILSLRGQWQIWSSEDGGETLPALPTLHPAFLLRQPAAKKKAWADMLALAGRLESL